MSNVGFSERMRDKASAIGMISRISGRFISFYADDLAEMLIDDILRETAEELNEIEMKS